jgi:hypothetical protein
MADVDLAASVTGSTATTGGLGLDRPLGSSLVGSVSGVWGLGVDRPLASALVGSVSDAVDLDRDRLLGSLLGGSAVVVGDILDVDELAAIIQGSCRLYVVSPEVIKHRFPTRNPLPQPATIRIVPQSPSEPQTRIGTGVRRRNKALAD